MKLILLTTYKLLFLGSAMFGLATYMNSQAPIVMNNIKMDAALETNGSTALVNEYHYSGELTNISNALPASLQGVDTYIKLSIDPSGELIINQALRDLFEVYLSALGEESLDIILLRIKHNLTQQLNNSALAQALALLDNYIAYRKELAEVQAYLNEKSEQLSQTEIFQLRKEKLISLRGNYFDQKTYEAFFQQEDLYDQFLRSRLDISQNTQLSDEDKQQQIITLENTLPENILRVRQSATEYGELHAKVTEMEKTGASAEQIFQVRSRSVGEREANALAELDKQRVIWKKRLADYQLYKKVLNDSMTSAQDKQQNLQSWLDEHFTPLEQLRVKAITASI